MDDTLPDLSVLLCYRDDEERIIRAVRALQAISMSAGVRVEIVPVDMGSGDNCTTLLKFLPQEHAVLRPPVETAARSLFGSALVAATAPILAVADVAAAVQLAHAQSAAALTSAYATALARRADAVRIAAGCTVLRRDRTERTMRAMVGIAAGAQGRLVFALRAAGRRVIDDRARIPSGGLGAVPDPRVGGPVTAQTLRAAAK